MGKLVLVMLMVNKVECWDEIPSMYPINSDQHWLMWLKVTWKGNGLVWRE